MQLRIVTDVPILLGTVPSLRKKNKDWDVPILLGTVPQRHPYGCRMPSSNRATPYRVQADERVVSLRKKNKDWDERGSNRPQCNVFLSILVYK